jgi:CMP-N,N'-diacetyllegionaminic acid synthase
VSGSRPEILALIPARGGSKSIPRKNLLPIAGRPLIAYSIAHALASRHITRVVVTTDDAEIAGVARAYGAEVPFIRPAELAADDSTDLDVFQHALTALHERDRYSCECVVHLRPTGPVRVPARIDEAIETLLRHPEADSLRSVTTPEHTPYKMWREQDGYLEPLMRVDGIAEPYCQPRQRLPQVYWQNGYVDIVRPRAILEMGLMCGRRILPFVMDEPVLELDYPEDVAKIEAALGGSAVTRPVRHST